jgi:predicted membrane channel-forming protein YqfA (hemolysin III family)
VTGLLLDDVSFWDVVWWMIMAFFFVMIIWMFISVFADIFRRDDLNGWIKALWVAVIFILPFLGIILYFCFRPRETESDRRMMAEMRRASGYSGIDEVAKAQQLLQAGAITQAEFDTIKARALG